MQYNTKNSNKATALYARFSRNDSDDESNSIANQRKVLQDYAKEKGFTRIRFYADDGISGTTFDRPDFQRLLNDIENGEIETVIVKDLSRFGRLSSMVGYYTDFYFPQNSIRFIAVFDDVDSEKGDNEFAPFKNIFNEWYARDTSRKVREIMKNKGESGGILCTKPIYGYKKDPDNKNHWLIDEEAAEVVRLIFNYCTEENLGTAQIAKVLRKDNIPTPYEYLRKTTDWAKKTKDKPSFWELQTVRNILRNQAYCGDIINFKTYRKSYKEHKIYKNAPENYRIFKGVNDSIISEEQFKKAQEILDRNRRVPTERKPDLFQGFLYCADCGKRLSVRRQKNFELYVCNTYGRNSAACTSHYIRQDVLSDFVLRQIRKLLYKAKNFPDEFIQSLQEYLDIKSEKNIKEAKKDLKKLQNRKSELDKIISKLYEDRVLEKISEERYLTMVTEFEKEQKAVICKIEYYQAELCSNQKNSDVINKFVAAVSKYDDITELNQYVLLDLVDKIVIKQKKDEKDYDEIIKIHFKEIGDIFFKD